MDWSPPVSATKCFAKPIAKIETHWMNALFEHLTWKFSHPGLNIALEFVCNGFDKLFVGRVFSS